MVQYQLKPFTVYRTGPECYHSSMKHKASNGSQLQPQLLNPEDLLSKSPCILGVESVALPTTLSIALSADTGRPQLLYMGKPLFKSRHFKNCLICGRGTGRNATCADCHVKARGIRYRLRCAKCSIEFTRLRYELEKALAKNCVDFYCGTGCSQDHHAIKNRRLCKTCKAPVKKKTRRYCEDCRPSRSYRCGRLSVIHCDFCGREFYPRSSRVRYCGKDCSRLAHSIRMRGKGNSHYKTGTSYADWFKKMRPVILERDGHCCVACGAKNAQQVTRRVLKRGGYQKRSRLTIHHIDNQPPNNIAENLVALCWVCHSRHHKLTDAGKQTPFPQLPSYAKSQSESMTSRLKEIATSLLKAYSSTTA